jgi:thrombospondin type 3 repeat protein
MSLIPPHRSGMYRRRFLGGLLALVALGAVAVAPMPSASAASGSGHVLQVQAGFETIVDTDGDGASDEAELAFGSDPNDASDYPEVQAGPDIVDSDGDGASDEAESAFGSDPNDPSDYPEVQAGPDVVDTDGDGASDAAEIAFGSDPNDASDYPEVQAGPESGSGKTVKEAAVVTALPNTGAQPNDGDDSGMLLLLVSGALAAGGLAGTRRLRNTR